MTLVQDLYKKLELDGIVTPETKHNWIFTGLSKNNHIAYFYCTHCSTIYNMVLHTP